MRKFKIIDVFISIALIVVLTILSIVKADYRFIYSYFIVGAWQVISVIIHAANGWFTKKGEYRFNYQRWVLVLVTGMLLMVAVYFIAPEGLMFFFPLLVFLLVAAPFLAVYYTYLCIAELAILSQRPLSQLK